MPQIPVNNTVIQGGQGWIPSLEIPVSYSVDEDFFISKKQSVEDKSNVNWRDKLVRDTYKLPAPPKQEPKYIDAFIQSNHLQFKNPEYPFADMKSHVGIEVEVENVTYINPNIPLCYWIIAEDGSLRNHGKEFKSVALPTSRVQLALEQLFNGLNPDIDFSSRTSIHVHVDVRGLTINQLITVLFTYAVLENVLFKFAGVHRRNSIFCNPITETRLFNQLNISDKHNLRAMFDTVWGKYSAMNLNPVRQFGTVEFRQFPGSADITKLCIWIDLLTRIKVYAYKHSLEHVVTEISQLNTTSEYRKFVNSVFGELIAYLDTTSLLADMEKAVYICKNCAAINEFHQRVLLQPSNTSSLGVKFKSDLSLELGKHYSVFKQLYEVSGYAKLTTMREFYYYVHKNYAEFLAVYKGKQQFRETILYIAERPI